MPNSRPRSAPFVEKKRGELDLDLSAHHSCVSRGEEVHGVGVLAKATMMLRDAFALAVAAVTCHMLLVTTVPLLASDSYPPPRGASSSSSFSRTSASTGSADLQRIEAMIKQIDLRLEAMDLRMKAFMASSSASELHPTKERVGRRVMGPTSTGGAGGARTSAKAKKVPKVASLLKASSSGDARRGVSPTAPNEATRGTGAGAALARALYPLLDELAAPDELHRASPSPSSSSATAASGGGHRGGAGAVKDPTELKTPAWLTDLLDDMRKEPGPPPATTRHTAAGVKSPASQSATDGQRQQRPAAPQSSLNDAQQTNRQTTASTAAPPAKSPAPARRKVTKSDDWEAEWDEEDAAEKEGADASATAANPRIGGKPTVNLLEELSRMLLKTTDPKAAGVASAKGKKGRKKGKVRKTAKATEDGVGSSELNVAPESIASDDEISIEDVD